jgi:hypothetical protein
MKKTEPTCCCPTCGHCSKEPVQAAPVWPTYYPILPYPYVYPTYPTYPRYATSPTYPTYQTSTWTTSAQANYCGSLPESGSFTTAFLNGDLPHG